MMLDLNLNNNSGFQGVDEFVLQGGSGSISLATWGRSRMSWPIAHCQL